MLNLIILASMILVAFTATSCYACNKDNKFYMSFGLCANADICQNETGRASLESLKICMGSNSTDTKQLLESANKLDPDECIEQLKKSACDLINDIDFKYSHCGPQWHEFKPSLDACAGNDGNMADRFRDMAKIYCAFRVKCRSDDAIQLKNVVKNCMAENVPELKEIEETGDECVIEAKNILFRARQSDRLNEFITCMSPKKELLDKFSSDQCDYS